MRAELAAVVTMGIATLTGCGGESTSPAAATTSSTSSSDDPVVHRICEFRFSSGGQDAIFAFPDAKSCKPVGQVANISTRLNGNMRQDGLADPVREGYPLVCSELDSSLGYDFRVFGVGLSEDPGSPDYTKYTTVAATAMCQELKNQGLNVDIK